METDLLLDNNPLTIESGNADEHHPGNNGGIAPGAAAGNGSGDGSGEMQTAAAAAAAVTAATPAEIKKYDRGWAPNLQYIQSISGESKPAVTTTTGAAIVTTGREGTEGNAAEGESAAAVAALTAPTMAPATTEDNAEKIARLNNLLWPVVVMEPPRFPGDVMTVEFIGMKKNIGHTQIIPSFSFVPLQPEDMNDDDFRLRFEEAQKILPPSVNLTWINCMNTFRSLLKRKESIKKMDFSNYGKKRARRVAEDLSGWRITDSFILPGKEFIATREEIENRAKHLKYSQKQFRKMLYGSCDQESASSIPPFIEPLFENDPEMLYLVMDSEEYRKASKNHKPQRPGVLAMSQKKKLDVILGGESSMTYLFDLEQQKIVSDLTADNYFTAEALNNPAKVPPLPEISAEDKAAFQRVVGVLNNYFDDLAACSSIPDDIEFVKVNHVWTIRRKGEIGIPNENNESLYSHGLCRHIASTHGRCLEVGRTWLQNISSIVNPPALPPPPPLVEEAVPMTEEKPLDDLDPLSTTEEGKPMEELNPLGEVEGQEKPMEELNSLGVDGEGQEKPMELNPLADAEGQEKTLEDLNPLREEGQEKTMEELNVSVLTEPIHPTN